MQTLIYNALLVNEGKTIHGALLINGEQIAAIYTGGSRLPKAERSIDANGAYLLPGIIDTHVHFREPGLHAKADMVSESRAALAGGVTSVMDMPNVIPQTTTNTLWAERMQLAKQSMRTNYAFYLGATATNLNEILHADLKHVPAVKLFMGSSTGGMLVEGEDTLEQLFSLSPLPIMTHCEDTARIQKRMAQAKEQWGEDPEISTHSWIRDREACLRSSRQAATLARKTGVRLHLAHLTTKEELELVGKNISAEVCVGHLLFSQEDYATLGTRIKVNPSIKTMADREALRKALRDGRILTIATDHAPHTMADKEGGAIRAASGMPMIQFSLPAMLDLVAQNIISIERMVELMAHAPASLYNMHARGYLRVGYQADLVLVKAEDWTLKKKDILSKCAWSPLEGHTFHHRIIQTYLNGDLAYDNGILNDCIRGQALEFER